MHKVHWATDLFHFVCEHFDEEKWKNWKRIELSGQRSNVTCPDCLRLGPKDVEVVPRGWAKIPQWVKEEVG